MVGEELPMVSSDVSHIRPSRNGGRGWVLELFFLMLQKKKRRGGKRGGGKEILFCLFLLLCDE